MLHVTCHLSCVTRYLSPVICHPSPVTFQLSAVICHLSPTATATATDPPPANSPTMNSRLVCQKLKPKNPTCLQNQKYCVKLPKQKKGFLVLQF